MHTDANPPAAAPPGVRVRHDPYVNVLCASKRTAADQVCESLFSVVWWQAGLFSNARMLALDAGCCARPVDRFLPSAATSVSSVWAKYMVTQELGAKTVKAALEQTGLSWEAFARDEAGLILHFYSTNSSTVTASHISPTELRLCISWKDGRDSVQSAVECDVAAGELLDEVVREVPQCLLLLLRAIRQRWCRLGLCGWEAGVSAMVLLKSCVQFMQAENQTLRLASTTWVAKEFLPWFLYIASHPLNAEPSYTSLTHGDLKAAVESAFANGQLMDWKAMGATRFEASALLNIKAWVGQHAPSPLPSRQKL